MISYYKEIFLYVKKMVSDKSSANDITQETFTRVIRANKNTEIENERAFLYKVAKNLIIEQSRKNIKTIEVSYEEEQHYLKDAYDSQKSFEQHKQNLLLKQAIKKLPKQRRQVFILYIIDGYSREEIASILNISANSINLHISRASSQLKKIIKELEGES
jgi:RNA polymerase sigma-70 factor, ECF subfamily